MKQASIPALRKQRQEGQDLKVSFRHTENLRPAWDMKDSASKQTQTKMKKKGKHDRVGKSRAQMYYQMHYGTCSIVTLQNTPGVSNSTGRICCVAQSGSMKKLLLNQNARESKSVKNGDRQVLPGTGSHGNQVSIVLFLFLELS